MLMNSRRYILLIILWYCFQIHASFACRYNVRETGFLYLGSRPYYFYGFVSEDTPAQMTSTFKQISHAFLKDSNIHFELINTHHQKDHPAMKHLDLWQVSSYPAAILVSPDGQSLVLQVHKKDEPFDQTLKLTIGNILSSPKREEIIDKVIETYGVILLLEGKDAEKNSRAREAISGAIERITRQMKMMPKRITHPPALISMAPESFSREKILLWSLGLDDDRINAPHATVFYGRGRWIGPLMNAQEITETNLANILFVVGADCECGFDLSWVQGTMLPADWGEKRQSTVAKFLGFDPENPMVKMEMSRILKKGSSFYPGVPVRYPDIDKNSESSLSSNRLNKNRSYFQVSIVVLVCLVVLIVILGLMILTKYRHINSQKGSVKTFMKKERKT